MINFSNMFTKFFAVLLALVALTNADLEISFNDITVTKVDPDYIVDAEASVSDNSATEGALLVNFTITNTLPENTEARLALLGASMGEYVVPSGIDFKLDMCEMMDEPLLLGPALTALGFQRIPCPPTPGAYGTSGFTLPTENLPEDFTRNKYKATFELLNDENIILQIQLYVEVE